VLIMLEHDPHTQFERSFPGHQHNMDLTAQHFRCFFRCRLSHSFESLSSQLELLSCELQQRQPLLVVEAVDVVAVVEVEVEVVPAVDVNSSSLEVLDDCTDVKVEVIFGNDCEAIGTVICFVVLESTD
jgi:hypothetical protein